MDNEQLVRNWQAAIIRDSEEILGRRLDDSERQFIASRGGFLALETIHDTVKYYAGDPAKLAHYLGSERRSQSGTSAGPERYA